MRQLHLQPTTREDPMTGVEELTEPIPCHRPGPPTGGGPDHCGLCGQWFEPPEHRMARLRTDGEAKALERLGAS